MEAVIYSNGNQECERAKVLLEKLNFQIQVYKLNQHFSERGFVEEFGEEAEYPQVNIGFRHVGGLKETLNYFNYHKNYYECSNPNCLFFAPCSDLDCK